MIYADNKCRCAEKYENGNHVYIFTGPCVVTGKIYSVEVPGIALFKYRHGAYMQDAMPMVSPANREFLMTGYSPEGWYEAFKSECSLSTDEEYENNNFN